MAYKKVTAAMVSGNRKPTRTKAKKDSVVEAIANIEPTIDDAANVFTTFSTSVVLYGGLNVIRPLGDGKYEIINLNATTQNVVGSVDMAMLVKTVPERQAALTIDEKQWDAAKLKCNVAVRITSKTPFPTNLHGKPC